MSDMDNNKLSLSEEELAEITGGKRPYSGVPRFYSNDKITKTNPSKTFPSHDPEENSSGFPTFKLWK